MKTQSAMKFRPIASYLSFSKRAISVVCLWFIMFWIPFPSMGNENSRQITGRITSADVTEPMDFTVTAYLTHDRVSSDPAKIVTTDHRGVFTLAFDKYSEVVLDVTGEQGSGRVYVSDAWDDDTLRITYPVTETVVLLHTNDYHFDMNKPDELAEMIESIRTSYQDVYLLEAGDIFVRHPHRWEVNGTLMESPEWYAQRALQMIAWRNDQHYDVMTPGNHEFAYIENYTQTALNTADFPLIAANIEINTDLLPQFDDYVSMHTKTGRDIFVLGLSNDNARKEGVKQNDIFETAGSFMHLRDSANVFVALTHIGLNRDKTLAEKFPQIDIIIGGHSHDLLEQSVLVNGVLVAMAGGNPHIVSDDHPVYLGKIVVELVNGVVKNKRGYVIKI